MLAKLTDICDIQYGYAFDSAQFSETEGIPLVRIRDVVRGFSETRTTESFPEEYLVHDGDILIGMDGEFNIARWHGGTAALNQRVCRLLPKKVKTGYIFHFMPSALKAIEDKTPFVTVKHLSAKELNRIMVPIPEPDEQIRIGTILNKVREIIDFRQRQLRILDTLIKARFVEMFGDPETNPMDWPIETLGTLLSVEPQNGLYKPQSDYVQDGTGIPILRIDAFYDGKVNNFSRLKRLICNESEKQRYLLMENDIVINRVNSIEYLGKCAWITGMNEPTIFESNMMRFHVDENKIDPCYLTRLLCSTFIYNQILNRAKKAVNQASINQGDVQSFAIVIPPLSLQREFAAFFYQIDKSGFDEGVQSLKLLST